MLGKLFCATLNYFNVAYVENLELIRFGKVVVYQFEGIINPKNQFFMQKTNFILF